MGHPAERTPWGVRGGARKHGVLRLRMPIRFAHRHALLRMTMRLGRERIPKMGKARDFFVFSLTLAS
jgi:hypothetical protein